MAFHDLPPDARGIAHFPFRRFSALAGPLCDASCGLEQGRGWRLPGQEGKGLVRLVSSSTRRWESPVGMYLLSYPGSLRSGETCSAETYGCKGTDQLREEAPRTKKEEGSK